MNFIDKVKKTYYRVRRIFVLIKYRMENKNKDFTLISQNCIGGVVYADLGIEFKSPTINMFIEDENFVKLVENFEYYMSIKPTPKCEQFVEPMDESVRYPKILIDDIEICCLHYKSCQEAIEAWERRKSRINYNMIYVIANSWNLHERPELIERLCNTKYKTIIFTKEKYDLPECMQLPGDIWKADKRGIIRPNLTDKKPNSPHRYYETFWDFVGWLNEK